MLVLQNDIGPTLQDWPTWDQFLMIKCGFKLVISIKTALPCLVLPDLSLITALCSLVYLHPTLTLTQPLPPQMPLPWSVKRLLASPTTDLLVWASWLLLVAASLLLPLYLGAALLSARSCTPHHALSLPPGLLSSLDPTSFFKPPDPNAPPGPQPSLLEVFLDPEVHLELLTQNGTYTNISVQVTT